MSRLANSANGQGLADWAMIRNQFRGHELVYDAISS